MIYEVGFGVRKTMSSTSQKLNKWLCNEWLLLLYWTNCFGSTYSLNMVKRKKITKSKLSLKMHQIAHKGQKFISIASF